MAAKKPRAKSQHRTRRSTDDPPEHRFTIVLEDIHSKLAGLAEGLTMTRESLERRMGGLEHRMDGLEHRMEAGFAEHGVRITRLESAILTHSEEIRNLAARVGGVESKLDAKADASRVDGLEARVLAHGR